MGGKLNPKIIGATVIGLALVAGAYTISNFGESNFPQQPATALASEPLERVSIVVTDNDKNGIEDWRDAFVDAEIVNKFEPGAPYVPPDTLTGKVGVKLLEGMIESRIYAPFTPSDDEVVNGVVESIEQGALVKLVGTEDLVIMEESDDQDIVNYANTVAATIYRHGKDSTENELVILDDILRNDKQERTVDLEKKALVYQNIFADTLEIPVPKIFVKEHLDLLNTYQAVHEDIDAMSKIIDDPLLSLVYLKRYPNNIEGMTLALGNMYAALEKYADLFGADDPALLFNIFSPDNQPNN
ncbi:hypothetical protein H6785_02680 [Candidatus Nomurabacteria bacterium]|nr:hypothetical protein [Candidatus Kaiserbacteria bacterium]MCB9815455.1 hypothetical protein [Candidatus Nomurabacteria bacterium]